MLILQLPKSGFVSKPLLACLLALLVAPDVQAQAPQGLLDGRLLGNWLKSGSGENVRFSPNGDLQISFSGAATVYNGVGSVERCADGGANICLVGPRFRCAYRYAFASDGLNLAFRTGGPDVACKAAAGDYKRVDP
jgi:hypothetical protein